MAREKLGEIRKKLYERYSKVAEQVKHYSLPDLVAGKVEKTLWTFLKDLGVDYPLDFDRPPPDVYVPIRQGTCFLEPKGSTTGGSTPIPLDRKCITFRARDGGFLVVDSFDIIMEDPIAEDFFKITYAFDGQVNSAEFQRVQGEKECGRWKFGRFVLVDGEVAEICVENPNDFAGGAYSFEGKLWSL